MSDHSKFMAGNRAVMEELMCEPTLGARRRAVGEGAMLHDSGQQAREIFYISKGQVRLYHLGRNGSRRLMDILGPGDWFGAASLAGVTHYGCQAQAASDSTLCILPAERLMPVLSANPRVSMQIIRDLACRARTADDEASEMAFDDCRRRLLKALLKFSRTAAARATPEGVVLHMTHNQLAEAVGAARETVSLMLTQLRDENLLKTGRNRVMFSPPAIERLLKSE